MNDQLDLFPAAPLDTVALRVAPGDVHVDPETPEPDAALRRSVRLFGVLQPVLLVRRGASLDVMAGRRRTLAARMAELPTIPALVVEDEYRAHEVLALVENATRSPNPVGEASQVRALLAKGATEKDIQQATGLPVSTIRKRARLAALPEPLFDAASTGRMAAGVAETAANLSPVEQGRLVAVLAARCETDEERARITAEDVADVRRVRSAAAMQALPVSLFAPSPAETAAREQPVPVTPPSAGVPTLLASAAMGAVLAGQDITGFTLAAAQAWMDAHGASNPAEPLVYPTNVKLIHKRSKKSEEA
jgi:ParB/RepB/Spo0J family partition protein